MYSIRALFSSIIMTSCILKAREHIAEVPFEPDVLLVATEKKV